MNTENFKTQTNICHLVTTGINDLGTFIKQGEAKQRIADYFKVTHTSPTDPNLIFGQVLGLNPFKALIAKIDAYNIGQSPAEQICAIRIYNAMSLRPYLPSPDDKTLLADIVVIPVLANGK